MTKYSIGMYIRLSQADRDLSKKEGKSESESISHQRDLIHNYLKSHKEFKNCKKEEFFDDGYSGTNFNRPSFEKLLTKIKSGEINLIIVKDFSRFGRDYIELGEYLERIFPLLNVRFISVNDNYDSDDYKGTTGGFDVVMKNIIYSYYSKDLSLKVTSGKRAKQKRGEWGGGSVPYGLMLSPESKKKLTIDPDAAPVIRHIFDMALAGKGTGEIARTLNEEGVLTPGSYYSKKHPESNKYKSLSSKQNWTGITVHKIIQQEMYYGAIVSHKRKPVTPCSKHTVAVPKEEQIIVENMHEALIPKEEWLKAQSAIRTFKTRPVKVIVNDYPLRSIVRCAYCNRLLNYDGRAKLKYFKCINSVTAPHGTCDKAKINEDTINEVVFDALQKVFSLAKEMDCNLEKKKTELSDNKIHLQSQITEIQKHQKKLEQEKYANVDAFMAEKISKEDYFAKREKLDSAIAEVSVKLKELNSRYEKLNAKANEEMEGFMEKLNQYSTSEKLTNEMAKTFIKNVYVYDSEHVEIEWNFDNEFLADGKK